MQSNIIEVPKSQFDTISQHLEKENVEFWFARDLMPLWINNRRENFYSVIQRAIDSCKTTIFAASRKWSNWEVVQRIRLKISC